MLTKLPLVFSTFLFSLSGSDGRADAPAKPAVETRAPKDHGARSERSHERRDLCAMLSCTAAQRVEIEGVIAKMKEQLKALHGNRGAEGKALADAMRDGSLDRKEVLGAFAKGDEIRAKREAIFADAIVAVYGKLDKAQRARLTTMVESRGAKGVLGNHGGHRGHDKASPGGKQKPGAAKAKRADKGSKAGRADKPGKAERKASKLARFDRVKAPVAKVDGFKSRS
ncbi:MAG TPA: hypothetical protein VG755_37285 [Nannocystaceae bacterium]|nr:hypothetical protein [Nannocystaceae bacterium]